MDNLQFTIVYSNGYKGEQISWLGSTWESRKEATEMATKVCEDLRDTMPRLSFKVFAHRNSWREER